jgi:hypothetical protein
MESSDAEQHGITLSPQTATRLIAEAAARQVVIEHIALCPFAGSKVDERLRNLEASFARLTGFMLGSGLLGGATVEAVRAIIGH